MSNNDNVLWPGWETVRLIGRGSFGAVYEIERDVFGHKEKAAVKLITIPQSDSDIEELYDSGYDEASVTATFKSHLESIVNEYSLMREMNGAANVVNCDDFRIVPHDDGIGWDIFIRMELLTPLTKALDRQPSDEEVIRIAKDMCNALILCRKNGIIHRDIKPQNIFMSRNGDYKLGDFGIAKTIEKTSGGTKIGTYKYMAPEVYNNQPYNHTADIYSLGLVLHWMLNERRSPFMPLPPAPVVASKEDEARVKRFSGTPLPAPANGSEELKQIVLKACAFDPKDRYQSAEEMLKDLEKLESRNFSVATELERAEDDEMADGKQTEELLQEETASNSDGTIGLFDKKESKVTAPSIIIEESEATIGAFDTKETSVKEEPQKPHPKPPNPKKSWTILVCVIAVIALVIMLCVGSGIVKPGKTFTHDGVSYTLDGTSLTVSGEGSVEYIMNAIPEWDSIKTGIRSITINPGVKSIGNWAFSGCSRLTSVTIPDSVKTIGLWSFSDCSSLTSVAIPDGVMIVGDHAFFECSSLTSVTIPDSVTWICNSSFSGCSSLTSVMIPDSVTSIDGRAFYECRSLTSVTIPESVISIGELTFSGCSRLTSVTIPDSVAWIHYSAFSDCSSLRDVYYGGSEEQWKRIDIRDGNEALNNAVIHYNVK